MPTSPPSKARTSAARNVTAAAVAAVTAGTLAAAALTAAAPARASCVSLFGIGNNADCKSNSSSTAIAIGTGAKAEANGLFGNAFAVGTTAVARTFDSFQFATAVGTASSAEAQGLFGIADAIGANTSARTQGSPMLANLGLNIAINVTPVGANRGFPATKNNASALGVGNLAVNLFGPNPTLSTDIQAIGALQAASNVGGSAVTVGSINLSSPQRLPNSAFNLFGESNTVLAEPGPFAIAGSILQTGQLVKRVGPGININGLAVGGAAALRHRSPAAPAAAGAEPGSGPAASVNPHKGTAHRRPVGRAASAP